MKISLIFLDEEISQDFQDMWLEQRHDEECSIFGQSPDGLIEIRLAFFDGFFSHISSNGIKSTLIDNSIKTLIFVLSLQIGHISEFVSKREILWLTFLHLFDYSFLIINALDREVLESQVGDELLREVRITTTRHENLLISLDIELQIVLEIFKTSIPLKTFLESFKLEELLPILGLL